MCLSAQLSPVRVITLYYNEITHKYTHIHALIHMNALPVFWYTCGQIGSYASDSYGWMEVDITN